MCTFISTLSKHSSTIIGAKNKNIAGELYLRECKDAKTYYRVRLLGFSSKTGRDDPHITRYVHSTWTTDPSTGKKRLQKIVCPTTPWVNVEGNKAASCKICNYSSQQWTIYQNSGKSDKVAVKKAFASKKTFEAIIPVYVISDPNYEKNAGKFKVIIMNDPKLFKEFRDKINAQLRIAPVFNGKGAVDCVIHVGSEITETGYKRTFIDKIKFSTEPYDLPAINSQSIDAFPYDETFFTASDSDEINEYYEKFCAISNNDIPDDDDIPVYTSSKSTTQSSSTPTNIPSNPDINSISSNDVSTDDLTNIISSIPEQPVSSSLKSDPLVDDLDEIGLKSVSKPSINNEITSKDILAELGI